MEEFTKEQRHEIYVKALLIGEKEDEAPFGLCIWIEWAMDKWRDINDFPEIIKHMPTIKHSPAFWFPSKDKETRIKILKQAISETE